MFHCTHTLAGGLTKLRAIGNNGLVYRSTVKLVNATLSLKVAEKVKCPSRSVCTRESSRFTSSFETGTSKECDYRCPGSTKTTRQTGALTVSNSLQSKGAHSLVQDDLVLCSKSLAIPKHRNTFCSVIASILGLIQSQKPTRSDCVIR